jgi:predicted negative regulator of RcsB-dependent stress response
MNDLDEYEQSEKLRNWLRQNWLAIAVGIGLGLGGLSGWNLWQSHSARHAAEAQEKFRDLVAAIDGGKPDAEIDALKQALRSDYDDTPYAALAALREAQSALKKGDLESAEHALDAARDGSDEPALRELVALRLAQVKLAREQPQQALDLLADVASVAYKANVAEIRGDALLALARRDEARAAYDEALTALDAGSPRRNFLEMKRNDVAANEVGAGT